MPLPALPAQDSMHYPEDPQPPKDYNVGDLVLTREQKENQSPFDPKWTGPYEITGKLSNEVFEVIRGGLEVPIHVDDICMAPPGNNVRDEEIRDEDSNDSVDPSEATTQEDEAEARASPSANAPTNPLESPLISVRLAVPTSAPNAYVEAQKRVEEAAKRRLASQRTPASTDLQLPQGQPRKKPVKLTASDKEFWEPKTPPKRPHSVKINQPEEKSSRYTMPKIPCNIDDQIVLITSNTHTPYNTHLSNQSTMLKPYTERPKLKPDNHFGLNTDIDNRSSSTDPPRIDTDNSARRYENIMGTTSEDPLEDMGQPSTSTPKPSTSQGSSASRRNGATSSLWRRGRRARLVIHDEDNSARQVRDA